MPKTSILHALVSTVSIDIHAFAFLQLCLVLYHSFLINFPRWTDAWQFCWPVIGTILVIDKTTWLSSSEYHISWWTLPLSLTFLSSFFFFCSLFPKGCFVLFFFLWLILFGRLFIFFSCAQLDMKYVKYIVFHF